MTLNSKRGSLTVEFENLGACEKCGLSAVDGRVAAMGGGNSTQTRNILDIQACQEWISEVICHVLDVGFFKNQVGILVDEPLHREAVDSILWVIFRLNFDEFPTGFDILVYSSDCLNRAEQRLKELKKRGDGDEWKITLVDQLRKKILSWLTLTLQLPDMFPTVASQLAEGSLTQARVFANLIYKKKISEESIEFIVDQIECDSGEEVLKELFSKVFWELTTLVRAKSVSDSEYVLPYEALRLLTRNPKLAKLLVRLPNWFPDGRTVEDVIRRTYLGPFLLLDIFCDYDHSNSKNQASYSKKHETIFKCQRIISDVIGSLLRNPDCRSHMLDWFAEALRIHKNRTNISEEVEYFTISDSFLVTLSSCLLSRCTPFACLRSKKYLEIDPEYFFKSERIRSVIDRDCTRLATESTQCKQWIDGRLQAMSFDASVHTIEDLDLYVYTECFYLALVALNLGYNPLYPKLRILDRKQRNLEYYFHEFDLESESMMEYYSRLEYEKTVSTLRLTDSRLVLPIFYFWELVGIWLVKLSQSRIEREARGPLRLGEGDSRSIYTEGLAMNVPVSMALKVMPEFFLDSFANFFLWVREYWLEYRWQSFSDVISVMITFFSSPKYMDNPFLRRKLVNLFILLTPKHLDTDVLEKNPFKSDYVMANLGPSLSNIYVDSNKNDSASSFANFEIRHNLSIAFVPAWKGMARVATIKFWKENPDHAVAFCNTLICDLIYFLDESLILFTEAFNLNVRTQPCCLIFSEKAQKVKELVKKANFYLSLAEQGLRFMYKLCRDSAQLFRQDRLTETLGTMLNMYIYQLCATRCKILQVELPKVRFCKSEWLLRKTCMIILFLYWEMPSVAGMLAKDQRCMSENLYANVRRIVKERKIILARCFSVLDCLVDDTERIARRNMLTEESLGDIPDEFLDAITSNIMKDPVQLPGSRAVVDRSTIQRYLLSSHVDPFNRQPLRVEQVVPLPHLLKKIEDFVASKTGDDS